MAARVMFLVAVLFLASPLTPAAAAVPDRHVLWLTTPASYGRVRPPLRMSVLDSRGQCEQELRQQMAEVLSTKRAEKIRSDAGPAPRAATVEPSGSGWMRFEFWCLPVGVNP